VYHMSCCFCFIDIPLRSMRLLCSSSHITNHMLHYTMMIFDPNRICARSKLFHVVLTIVALFSARESSLRSTRKQGAWQQHATNNDTNRPTVFNICMLLRCSTLMFGQQPARLMDTHEQYTYSMCLMLIVTT
jgi:hypothetical protein